MGKCVTAVTAVTYWEGGSNGRTRPFRARAREGYADLTVTPAEPVQREWAAAEEERGQA
jgi:hypothetical protein